MKRHLLLQHARAFIPAMVLVVWAMGVAPSIAQTSIGLRPAVDRFYCTEVLEVSLQIGGVADLRGFSVDLGFDTAVLSPIDVVAGDALTAAGCPHFLQWMNPDPGEDHIAVDVGLLGCSISGSGELLKLHFSGVANGQSSLTVISAILRDGQNHDVPFSIVDSVVDYRCPRPGTVTFDPPDGGFGCNQTLAVDVVIDGFTVDLHGASLEIAFDNTVVRPLSVTAGSLVAGAACPYYLNWLNPGPAETTIQVDVANLGCAIDGPGAIVHLVFEGVLQGISPLDCLSLIFRDSANHPIDMECVPGTIEYRCPVGIERTGWGAWKAQFGG